MRSLVLHAVMRPAYIALAIAVIAPSIAGCVEETPGSIETSSSTSPGETSAVSDHADEMRTSPNLEQRLRDLLDKRGGSGKFILPDTLEALPQDPSNPLTPARVELGGVLFHDPLLADRPRRQIGRHTYACATCHIAERGLRKPDPRSDE